MSHAAEEDVGRMTGQETLTFDHDAMPGEVGEERSVHRDISAICRIGNTLFLACDETLGVERLTRLEGGWGDHVHFGIGEIIDALPGVALDDADAGDEIDIEALCIDDGMVWLIGSQSWKRKNPEGCTDPKKAMKRLRRTELEENRQFLGALPLGKRDGLPAPMRKADGRKARHLKFVAGGKIRKWLRKDRLFRDFVDLPGKDNGLDIEGLAVRGARVWLGLRGPVFRGHAVVLEMEMKTVGRKLIKPRRIDGKRRYRTHLLDLGGEGIRDLEIDGADLLILTGTAMANDGRAAVLRWRRGLERRTSGVVPAGDIVTAATLPYRSRTDNPEGLARWDANRWVIAHDSPAGNRIGTEPPRLKVDIWELGG